MGHTLPVLEENCQNFYTAVTAKKELIQLKVIFLNVIWKSNNWYIQEKTKKKKELLKGQGKTRSILKMDHFRFVNQPAILSPLEFHSANLWRGSKEHNPSMWYSGP